MKLSPTVSSILKAALVVLTILAGFGPDLPLLKPLLPPAVYHAATVICALALYLTQSPLVKPLLANPETSAKQAVASQHPPPMRPPPMAVFCLVLTLLLCACISSAPIVPVTPANADQISTCQTTAEIHNGFVVGDFVVGGAAVTLPTVAAALPSTSAGAKTDLAVTSAVVAGVLGVGAAMTGYTAANFTNSNCSSVVGALPPAPASSAKGTP
jgi:hypothetical protein